MPAPFKTESMMRDLRADLIARLPGALTTVEARYASLDPIPLPVPTSYGWSLENLLLLAADQFPRITLIGASWRQTGSDDTRRLVFGEHQVQIAYNLIVPQTTPNALDHTTYYAWRYGEAIQECIAVGNAKYGGFSLSSKYPTESADMEVLPHAIGRDRGWYVCGGLFQYTIAARYAA